MIENKTCTKCDNKALHQKDYYKNNRTSLLIKQKEYNKKNKDRISLVSKEYYKNNKEKMNTTSKVRYEKNIEDWKNYLIQKYGQFFKCQICGKELGWFTGNQEFSVNFDHRNEGHETIKGHPRTWMGNKLCIPKNIQIFESCDFGLLCKYCNLRLPTKGRKEWLRQLNQYVYKKDM